MQGEDYVSQTFSIVFQDKASIYQQNFREIGVRKIVDLIKHVKINLWNKIDDLQKKRWVLIEVLSQFLRQDQQIYCSTKILFDIGVMSLDALNELDESDWKQYKILNLKDNFKEFLRIDQQLSNQLGEIIQQDKKQKVITNLVNYQVLNHKKLSSISEQEALSLGFTKIQLKQLLKLNSSQNQQPNQVVKRLNDLKQNSQKLEDINGLQIYLYPKIIDRNIAEYKTLIVVGESGCGKTSFLNFLCNYYLGIQFEDNFRFILIKENLFGETQAMSQTQDINAYYLRPYDGRIGLKIIDTPGFGDSRGLERDLKIAEEIKVLFQKKVETVTAICFVVKATQSRSTPSQNYILSQMKQYFGQDIKQNIIFIFPFSAAEIPLAIENLSFSGNQQQAANEISELVNEFISNSKKTQDQWFFKVENKAMFYNFNNPTQQEYQFYKYLWDFSYQSFQTLIQKKLLSIKDNSLQLTKDVIKKRDNLVLQVQFYKEKLKKNIELQKRINEKMEIIQQEEENIKNAKNKIQIFLKKKNKVPISNGEQITNCRICETTCHYICFIEGNDKQNCEAMNVNNYCSICEKKCHYSQHQNDKFRYEIILETDEIEVEKYRLKCQVQILNFLFKIINFYYFNQIIDIFKIVNYQISYYYYYYLDMKNYLIIQLFLYIIYCII